MKRKHLSTKELYARQLEQNRLRNQKRRKEQRAKVLRGLKSEIDRVSAGSKVAEALSVQVKLKKPQERRTAVHVITEKLISQITTKNVKEELKERAEFLNDLMAIFEKNKSLPNQE